jgi:hypothetical protein
MMSAINEWEGVEPPNVNKTGTAAAVEGANNK